MKPPEGKPPLRNLDIAEVAFYGFLIMCGVFMGLLMAFQGDVHFLLPLYALGVLLLFAVSRLGMV